MSGTSTTSVITIDGHAIATLPDATLVEVDTPTHLLWLGDGSDRAAAEITFFITTKRSPVEEQ
jgi:hypothetical protein